jgi:hypothetical protein
MRSVYILTSLTFSLLTYDFLPLQIVDGYPPVIVNKFEFYDESGRVQEIQYDYEGLKSKVK